MCLTFRYRSKSQVFQSILVSHYLSVFPVGDAWRNLPLLLLLDCHLQQKGETVKHNFLNNANNVILIFQCSAEKVLKRRRFLAFQQTVPFCLGNAWQGQGEMEVLEESSCWSWNMKLHTINLFIFFVRLRRVGKWNGISHKECLVKRIFTNEFNLKIWPKMTL